MIILGKLSLLPPRSTRDLFSLHPTVIYFYKESYVCMSHGVKE